jgi:hypothetical protein
MTDYQNWPKTEAEHELKIINDQIDKTAYLLSKYQCNMPATIIPRTKNIYKKLKVIEYDGSYYDLYEGCFKLGISASLADIIFALDGANDIYGYIFVFQKFAIEIKNNRTSTDRVKEYNMKELYAYLKGCADAVKVHPFKKTIDYTIMIAAITTFVSSIFLICKL